MDVVILLTAVIACSFLVLRGVSMRANEAAPPSFLTLFFLGVVSWTFLLSMAAWFLYILFLAYALVAERMLGAVYSLIWIGLISALAVRLNEMLDTANVLHYIRQSALFRPMRSPTVLLQEELDKKKIRDVHREISGTPFPTMGTQKRLLTNEEIVQARSDARAVKSRKLQSNRLEDEVRNLRAGSPTSLSDTWKLYTFDHQRHEFYAGMSNVTVDPGRKTLSFRLDTPAANRQALSDPLFVFQLKQDLYQLLQVLNTDPWLAWYDEFFNRIAFVCFGIDPDSFGQTQMVPYFRLEIARSELSKLEGRFFNVADLHTISTIIFNNGEALPDDML